MVAPCDRTQRAVRVSIGPLSTEHGPAITTTSRPPMVHEDVIRIGTVRGGLESDPNFESELGSDSNSDAWRPSRVRRPFWRWVVLVWRMLI
jgi:hypothetical protein